MVAQSGFEPLISSLWDWWVARLLYRANSLIMSFPMKTSPHNQPSIFVCHHCHLSCHQPIVAIKLHGPMPGELKEENSHKQVSTHHYRHHHVCQRPASFKFCIKAQLSSLWSAPGLMTSWLTWAWSHDDLNPASMQSKPNIKPNFFSSSNHINCQRAMWYLTSTTLTIISN